MTQRAKEVLATLTDKELIAFMSLIGAKEAANTNRVDAQLIALRGGLASTDMPRESILEMREDVSGSLDALTRASETLLAKLDGLLEEAGGSE
tara:strand:+ start:1001 stop:1279 length:279 start_codon:yes stop_codon:yes gene_type:complete